MTGRIPIVPPGTAWVKRFWALVDRRGPDECWPWTRGLDKDGYGKFTIKEDGEKQRHVRAHRTALTLKLGRPPVGVTRHSCDNPICCNPNHLSEGTQLENRADAVARDRTAKGDRSPMRSDRALAMRVGHTRAKRHEWRGEMLTLREVAEREGVSLALLKNRLGHGWPLARAVTEPRTGSRARAQRERWARSTDATRVEHGRRIREAKRKGSLSSNDAVIEDADKGAFLASGTGVSTVRIWLQKKDL